MRTLVVTVCLSVLAVFIVGRGLNKIWTNRSESQKASHVDSIANSTQPIVQNVSTEPLPAQLSRIKVRGGYSADGREGSGLESQIVGSISTPLQTPAPKRARKFSLAADIGFDGNLRSPDDAQYQASTSITLKPSYRTSSKSTLIAEVAVEQRFEADQETALTNTTLILARDPISLTVDRDLNLSTFAVVPTNEADRNEGTLRGGAGLAIGFTQRFGFLRSTAAVGYTASALKNAHEFERSADGAANISHRLRHTFTYVQPLRKKLSLQVVARYQTGWTYQNVLRTSFLVSQQVNYEVNSRAQVYVGHTNDGDALQTNGIDSNVRVYDENQSHFTTGLVATY